MKGQVKWFSLKKGYGFITGEDSKDYFFHYTMMPQGVLLKEGDSINFEVLETEKGLQAKDITLSDTPVVVAKEVKSETEEETEELTKPTSEEEAKEETEASTKPASEAEVKSETKENIESEQDNSTEETTEETDATSVTENTEE